ncbi:Lumazine-binding domain [Bergeyella zoohelcum]|uniref:Lumazine-binding domain n=2 Tax=Bergeyella zoohelcum TaxID=1015 RepID=A0A7Z8YQ35_9FLAO|nr:Lumazine-binding domain [Bergeyella zoohelcum]
MVACNSGNSPKSVATKFLEHVNKGEFEEAKKYCDGPTADLMGMINSFGGNTMKEELAKKGKDKKLEIIRVEEKDDKAKVYYKEGKGKEESLDLKKIDGKWKVSINKEDKKKEGIPSMKDAEPSATE